ncbi:MAG: hypothetical protein M1371_02980 [Actinobacteria bacterium]|nr:hypothetical protein [Actinomycetota bacterium]
MLHNKEPTTAITRVLKVERPVKEYAWKGIGNRELVFYFLWFGQIQSCTFCCFLFLAILSSCGILSSRGRTTGSKKRNDKQESR